MGHGGGPVAAVALVFSAEVLLAAGAFGDGADVGVAEGCEFFVAVVAVGFFDEACVAGCVGHANTAVGGDVQGSAEEMGAMSCCSDGDCTG